MKTKVIASALFAFLFASPLFAQDRTTVNATSSEISDNLDLRAVASIFGEAKNLEDFERRINDPEMQISNLDLNNDNRVDYLRVIETVEDYTHLIVVQSVLGRDTYQDVATIEVERDSHNQVSVQVVGDVYMYGPNYIYEPVYVQTPIIYTSFWAHSYRPYCSTWYWDYYPTYYVAWNPFPVFRYRNNINVYINFSNRYDYVSVRRSPRAVALYTSRRANYCERQYPTRAFAYRNTTVRNRYELDKTRNIRNVPDRNGVAYNNRGNSNPRSGTRTNATQGREYNASRANAPIRENRTTRADASGRNDANPVRGNRSTTATTRGETSGRTASNPVRENKAVTSRGEISGRNDSNPVRENRAIRNENPVRSNSNATRENSSPRSESIGRSNSSSGRDFSTTPRQTPRADNSIQRSAPQSQPRMESRGNNSMQRSAPQSQPRMESRGNANIGGAAQRQSTPQRNVGGNQERGNGRR
jgi:hypothetical protein